MTGDLVNMVIDEDRGQLYVTDRSGDSVIVINTTNNQVVERIGVGSGPWGVDMSPDGDELYVGRSRGSSLAVVNLTSLQVSRSINLTIGPTDLVAGRQGRVYYVDGDTWDYPRIVDTQSGVELGPITSADRIHGGLLRTSPDRRTLYVGETGITRGTIYEFAVHNDTPSFVGSSGFDAQFLGDFALSPDGNAIYAAASAPYYVSAVTTGDWSWLGQLNTGAYPNSVTLARGGEIALATRASWDVIAFNTTTFQEIKRYPLAHPGLRVRALDYLSRIFVITGDVFGTKYLEVLDTSPPTWPANSRLTALNIRTSGVTLSWTLAADDAGVTSYMVYMGNDLVGTVPGTDQIYNVTGLAWSTTYTFKVEASDSTSVTSDGPSLTVTTLYQPPDFELYLALSSYSMQHGWTHNPDMIRVRSLGGFSGSVSLSASVTPPVQNGLVGIPEYQALFVPANGTASCRLGIASNTEPLGEYLITVVGSWGTSAHSANLIVTVYADPSPPPPPPPGYYEARVLYQANYYGAPYRGSSIVISNMFTNQGSVYVRVTGLTITGEVGTFRASSGLPLYVQHNQTVVLNMTVTIPATARLGNNSITANIGWEYLDPSTSTWTAGPPLSAKGSIPVLAEGLFSPSSIRNTIAEIAGMLLGLRNVIVPFVIAYAAIVGLVGVLVIREEKRKRRAFSR